MHGETRQLHNRLLRAVLCRRVPQWLATLAPLVVAAVALPAARTAALAAMLVWAVWLAIDIYRWQKRVDRQWTSWLDAAIPALEDSSTLLGADAATPIAKLQQQRLQVRLAEVLSEDDYPAPDPGARQRREHPLQRPRAADPAVAPTRAGATGRKNWTLTELGMEPGDELYFFVRATDNAARPHTVQSPTYTLRLPAPPPRRAGTSRRCR
jgi:hypothetical protein